MFSKTTLFNKLELKVSIFTCVCLIIKFLYYKHVDAVSNKKHLIVFYTIAKIKIIAESKSRGRDHTW